MKRTGFSLDFKELHILILQKIIHTYKTKYIDLIHNILPNLQVTKTPCNPNLDNHDTTLILFKLFEPFVSLHWVWLYFGHVSKSNFFYFLSYLTVSQLNSVLTIRSKDILVLVSVSQRDCTVSNTQSLLSRPGIMAMFSIIDGDG